jgi:hypothetical protein
MTEGVDYFVEGDALMIPSKVRVGNENDFASRKLRTIVEIVSETTT